jgi:CubicO group peptidase (beta-lactamase class C family)
MMKKRSEPNIEGHVAPGFEGVRDAFAANFDLHNEVGAACAVVVDDELVVDLWGGMADRKQGRLWREDTLVNMFSTTKGMSALALAHAHSDGLLDYEERVAHYWPEFAQNGKGDVTVRMLLSHQAGLCAIDEELDIATLADPDLLGVALAKQAPAWTPGEHHGYHALSLGFYESQLIRRVDPRGRTIGRYFADEIAGPLDIEFYIGLPDDVPDERLARLDADWMRVKMLFNLRTLPPAFVRGFLNPRSLTARSFGNPKELGKTDRYNDRDVRRLELPASNGTGTARGVAKAYGDLAAGSETLGISTATIDALTEPAGIPASGDFDLVLQAESNFSLGYLKPRPAVEFGSPHAFGHPGAGGSHAFADPQLKMGFCYAMNRMGFHIDDDPRERNLRTAAQSAARSHIAPPQ